MLDEEPAGSRETVRSVRLQLSGENDERVDMRLVDQGGSLALSVRSSDSTLTRALQDRLPELNDRLAEQHYQSEVYLPQAASEVAAEGTPADAREADSNRSGSQQSSSQHADSGGNKQSSDSGSQSGSGGQQQQRGENTVPVWYRQLSAFGDEAQPWTLHE
jgi:preprotein translocase subunit SecD